MQSTPNLGELITDEDAERDAIHIAVAPVVAGDYLNPGQHVGFTDRDIVRGNHYKPVGVVDPFLKESVKRGQRFWLLLYPNTITSLRHEWIHPDIPPKPTKKTEMDVSECWLRAFADDYQTDYDTMMSDVAFALNTNDDCLHCLGSSRDVDYEVFWHHYKKVTNQDFSDTDVSDKWFRCAC